MFNANRIANKFLKLAMTYPEALKILGLTGNPTEEEIKKAYKIKAIENHPDRGGDVAVMAQINVAKDYLLSHPGQGGGPSDDFWAPNYSPSKQEPKKQQKRVITFEDAVSGASIPSATWIFRTNVSYSGYGDVSNSIQVFYGRTAQEHVFVSVQSRVAQNAFTGEDTDETYVNKVVLDIGNDLTVVAPKVLRQMMSEYNGKVVVFSTPINGSFDREVLNAKGVSMSFKDAMDGLGLVKQDSPWKGRKITVEIILRDSDEPRREGDYFTYYNADLIVNGKVFKLSDESGRLMSRKNIYDLIFGTYYYSDSKKTVTRIAKAKQVLTWMASNLTSEPPQLLEMLSTAASQAK